MEKVNETTLVGAVNGKPVVVVCPYHGCGQILAEPEDIWLDTNFTSERYGNGDNPIGSIDLGNYYKTPRVFCQCLLGRDYKGRDCLFALCWDPESYVGCRKPTDETVPDPDFNPPLSWYEVGVVELKDKADHGHYHTYKGTCLHCGLESDVNVSWD